MTVSSDTLHRVRFGQESIMEKFFSRKDKGVTEDTI